MILIDRYKKMNFEQKTIFTTKFSIAFNAFMALIKFVLGTIFGIFFIVAGVINILIMLAKLECLLGIYDHNNMKFSKRNMLISIFLMLAGIEYGIYIGRMIYSDVSIMNYDQVLGICIALISFIELGFAIKGCFNSYRKGHYYRNIKIINLCSAFTAISLTEVALMSFASENDTRFIDGLFGIFVGVIIVLLGLFIIILPKISLIDRQHNVYVSLNLSQYEEKKVNIQLTNSKFYGNYYYNGELKDGKVNGYLKQGKSPFREWNIYVQIISIVLSEILIFPYAVGGLIFHVKSAKIVDKLDKIMLEQGFVKESECEE